MILIFLAAMLPLLAQGPRPRGFGGPGPRGAAGAGGGGGANQVNYLAGYLGLTDAQKTKATAIFTTADTASTTLRGAQQSAQDALQAAVKNADSDAHVDQLAAAVGVAQGQLAAVRAKADRDFRALLTPDQKTKLDTPPARPGRP